MLRSKLFHYSTFLVLISLMLASSISAHHPADRMGTMPSADGRVTDTTSNMDIQGEIMVDTSIQLKVKIQPNQDTVNRMAGSNHRHHMVASDFTNEIQLNFLDLVEFQDLTNNGYTSDDVIVSSYNLSTENIGQPTLVDDLYYEISSLDDTIFKMKIDLNFEDDLFYGYKWSITLNYPFSQSDTQLAMRHEIITSMGRMSDGYRMRNGYQQNEDCFPISNDINDQNSRVPMFFSWASEVTVDGNSKQVISTIVGKDVSLTVPQGTVIEYDPIIGIDPSSLMEANNILDSFGSFGDTIRSPTIIGLLTGAVLIISLVIIAVRSKKVEV